MGTERKKENVFMRVFVSCAPVEACEQFFFNIVIL